MGDKVAVILTGHMRTWDLLKNNFQKTFIDRWHPDIFIYTWDTKGYWTEGPNPTKTGVNEQSPKLDFYERDQITNFYNPSGFVIDEYQYYDAWFEERSKKYLPNCEWGHKDDSKIVIRPKNAISQYYIRHQGVAMMEKAIAYTGDRYDLVFLTRPDIEWLHPLPDFDGKTFHTILHRNHRGEGTGDLLFVGNSDTISAFSKIIWYFDELNNAIGRFCPHIFAQAWIQSLKLPWQELVIPHKIWSTPNGEYKEWSGQGIN